MKLHDIEQGSEEWQALRLGKITGSCFNKLIGTSPAKEKYLYDRASEIVTGCRCDSDEYSSSVHMARGHEFEEIARMKYTVTTLNEVRKVGFVQLSEFVGCSPDGLVGDDGIVEIKIPDSNNYFRQIIELTLNGSNAIPKEHYIQMQFNMFVCKREWCDYVLYNPKHEINKKDLFIYRITRNSEIHTRIGNIIDECIEKIQKYIKQYDAIKNH